MSIQETTIQKLFNNSINHGYQRFTGESRLRIGALDLKAWVRNVVSLKTAHDMVPHQDSNLGLTVANREVHLEGFESHEDVVRAYLEFAGIDPDSKEGRLYFEL